MVGEIIKSKYKELVFFVLDDNRAIAIPKTMIFVNDIENV